MIEEELINKITEIKRKTAIIGSLGDIQEGLAVDVEQLMKETGMYVYYPKKAIRAIRKDTEVFRMVMNERYKGNDDMKLAFGEITDMLKEFIDDIINYKIGGTKEEAN